jgi:SP family sugar:H+ symporter-like MFS transporter
VAQYAALFLNGVGITDPHFINVIIALCIFARAFAGPFVIKYGERRFTMLTGYGIISICMLIFSAVSASLGVASPVAKEGSCRLPVQVDFLFRWMDQEH